MRDPFSYFCILPIKNELISTKLFLVFTVFQWSLKLAARANLHISSVYMDFSKGTNIYVIN